MFNYVVDKKDQGFIFNFARQARIENSYLLVPLHRKKSPEMIKEAFKVFKFDQHVLKLAASDPELMCFPNGLFNLLGKIEKQEDREWAIGHGVGNLFNNKRVDYIEPLLNAFESNESFKHLKDVAIKTAFISGSNHRNKPIVERFHDHHAVTSEVYAQGVIYSGRWSTRNPNFIFLLGGADQDDLNAVKKHWEYKQISDEFKKAIEGALLTAKPDGARLDTHRAKAVMELFWEDERMGIPIVLSQIIASYFVDESILKSITTSFKQTISIKRAQADNSADESA